MSFGDFSGRHYVEQEEAACAERILAQLHEGFPGLEVEVLREAETSLVEGEKVDVGEIIAVDGLVLVHGVLRSTHTPWNNLYETQSNPTWPNLLGAYCRNDSFSSRLMGMPVHPPRAGQPDTGELRALGRTMSVWQKPRFVYRGSLGWEAALRRDAGETKEESSRTAAAILGTDFNKLTWWHLAYLADDGMFSDPIFRPMSEEVPNLQDTEKATKTIYSYFPDAVIKGISKFLFSKERLVYIKEMAATRPNPIIPQPETGYSYGAGSIGGSGTG